MACASQDPRAIRLLPGRPGGLWLLLVLPLALGAGPFRVERVQVPPERLNSVFPARSELRTFSKSDFDELVRAAESGWKRSRPRAPAVILKSRHAMTWKDGSLEGQSELFIDATTTTRGLMELAPWTPAVRAPTDSIRGTPPGTTALALSPGETRGYAISWQLQARPGSEGRSFSIGLPACGVSEIVLDLPEGFEPLLPGMERSPAEPGPEPGWSRWRLVGPIGSAPIDLRVQRRDEDPASSHDFWVRGTTEVDLTDAGASWLAQWTIEPGTSARAQLQARFDARLEILGVEGAEVASYEAGAARDGSLPVKIVFVRPVAEPTTVVIRARAKLVDEGNWIVPAGQPLDGIWLGGRVTIRIAAAGRVLERYRGLQGPALPSRSSDTTSTSPRPTVLVFDPPRPEPVAELTFRKPRPEAVVDVRGRVLWDRYTSRLDVRVTWSVDRGPALGLTLDLASPWTVDKVAVAGTDEPLLWNTEPLAGDAGSRLHLTAPPSLGPSRPITVMITAAATGMPGPARNWALPRLRPVGAATADERWSAWIDPDLRVTVESARGLAWLDPDRGDLEPPESPGTILAWRWIDDETAARITLTPRPHTATATISELVQIAPDHLDLDLQVQLTQTQALPRTIEVQWEGWPAAPELAWTLGAEAPGSPVPSRPLESGQLLDLPAGQTVTLRTHATLPWDGSGSIPIPRLPDEIRPVGQVALAVDHRFQIRSRATDLWLLDRSFVERSWPRPRGPSADEADRLPIVEGFGFERGSPRLTVQTVPLQETASPGVILAARLTSPLGGPGPTVARLSLLLSCSRSAPFELVLPEGATIQTARIDRRPVEPYRRDGALVFDVVGPTEQPHEIDLSYLLPPTSGTTTTAGQFCPTWTWPCLAFTWAPTLPPQARIESVASPLIDATTPWQARSSGLLSPRLMPARPERPSRQIVDDLARRAWPGSSPQQLLEILVRWDAGSHPIVVDRLALSQSGWKPPSRVTRSERGRARDRLADLEALGLSLLHFNDLLLLTTPAVSEQLGAASQSAELAAALTSAVRDGSDSTDRFQSVANWVLRAGPSDRYQVADPLPAPGSGPTPSWLEQAGPPARQAGLTWRSLSADRTRSLFGFVLVLLVSRGLDRWPQRVRARAWLALLAITIWSMLWEPSVAQGLAVGLAATLGHALGTALAGTRRERSRSTITARPGSTLRTSGGFVAGLLLALAGLLLAQNETPQVIVAVATSDRPDRLVVRLDDVARLEHWARRDRPETGPSELSALSAEHVIGPETGPAIRVESRIEVFLDGDQPAAWNLPLGPAQDLSVLLDGEPVGAAVRPDGQSADVWITRPGRHVLHAVREIPRIPGEASDRIDVLVNPVPNALVRLKEVPEPLECVGLHGGILKERDGGWLGLAGPTDRFVIRWPMSTAAPRRPGNVASAEALLLWDSVPAGDGVLARVTFADLRDRSRLRIALSPGTLVRSAVVPGLVDVRLLSSESQTIWEARVDPPWTGTGVVELVLWRPGTERLLVRTLPVVQPLDIESFSAQVGLRRPSDWSGRLGSGAGEVIPDEAFVRAWGPLPPTELTFAGAVRTMNPRLITFAGGPMIPRYAVEPQLTLTLESGRLLVAAEARITPIEGEPSELQVQIPEQLHVTQVAGTQLACWSHARDDLLSLRFDPQNGGPRVVRLEGWLPCERTRNGRLPAPQGVGSSLDLPWLTWLAPVVQPGLVRINTPTEFGPRLFQGGRPIPPLPSLEGDSAITETTVFRLDDVHGLPDTRLEWDRPPTRVQVEVGTAVTVHPGMAELNARLEYQATGGSLGELAFSLPRAWSDRATVSAEDLSRPFIREDRGDLSFFSCKLDRPIWGRQLVRVRAQRSRDPGKALEVPEIMPRGQGQVTTYIALLDTRLQPVEPTMTGVERVDDAAESWKDLIDVPPVPTPVYRVINSNWKLALPAEDPADHRFGSRITAAEVVLVVAEDGSSQGLGRYQFRGTDLLSFQIPEDLEPIGAAVDGVPVPIRLAGDRSCSIPVDPSGLHQLEFLWQGRAVPDARGRGPLPLSLPVLDQAETETLLTVHAPDRLVVRSQGHAATPTPVAAVILRRAEGIARSLTPLLAHSANPDRAAIRSQVLGLELAFREAVRSAVLSGVSHSDSERIADRIRVLREDIATKVAEAGLSDLAGAVQSGISGRAPAPSEPLSVPPSLYDLLRLGRARSFIVRPEGSGSQPVLVGEFRASDEPRIQSWGAGLAGLLVLVLGWPLAGRLPVASRRLAGTLALLLVLGTIPFEPVLAAVLAASVVLGRGLWFVSASNEAVRSAAR